MTAATQTRGGSNGTGAQDPLTEAMSSEQAIADEAAQIRGEEKKLTPELFMKLWPLLRRPIPQGFIQSIGVTKGKPYESTGIKSVQVCIDRMNNVLTPLWWWERTEYERDGKLAFVTIIVGNRGARKEDDEVLVVRKSAGGVEQGSTTGNIHKGSFTNAAKLAIARVGPGHEVYLGATDLDPDVSTELAEAQAGEQPKAPEGIDKATAKKLVDRAWEIPGAKESLRLAASHAAGGKDVGDCDTKAKAVTALTGLAFDAAEKLSTWIARKATESEVENA